MIKPIPEYSPYQLTKDYSLVWELMDKGYALLGWAQMEEGSYIYDPVRLTKVEWGEKKEYRLGSRGIGYDGLEYDVVEFIKICKRFDIQFVPPFDNEPSGNKVGRGCD